ncbi:MAG: virB8 family protein [Methylotenera sp.]
MVTKVDKKNFANYLAEAKSWETDKVVGLEKSKRLAWIIASCAGVLTFLSVFALAMLSPLKTAVPYVIRVDNATGAVDVISALKDGKLTYDEAMNKYHVQWYVRWREGYSKNLINDYYKNVGIMSSPEEQTKYSQLLTIKNPNSPLNIYGNDGNVTITIKSTSFIKDNIASVRYIKEVKDQRGAKSGTTHWVATVIFQYAGTPMSEQDRAVNPLGFQVVEYRNDPDQEISENSLPSRVVRPQEATPAASAVSPAVPSIQ